MQSMYTPLGYERKFVHHCGTAFKKYINITLFGCDHIYLYIYHHFKDGRQLWKTPAIHIYSDAIIM